MQGRFKMEYRLFTIVRYNYKDYNKSPPPLAFLSLFLFYLNYLSVSLSRVCAPTLPLPLTNKGSVLPWFSRTLETYPLPVLSFITLITYQFSCYSSLVLLAFVLACACVPPSLQPSVHVLLAYQQYLLSFYPCLSSPKSAPDRTVLSTDDLSIINRI